MAGSTDAAALELAAAVGDVLGTLDYYTGPNARTAVREGTKDAYYRVLHARNRVIGEPCPTCDDTGIDRRYSHHTDVPCALATLEGHPDVPSSITDAYADYRAEQARRIRQKGRVPA